MVVVAATSGGGVGSGDDGKGDGDAMMAVRSLAIPHTASDLIWLQCQPCEQCYSQPFPIFNPHRSNTHKWVPCDSDSCKLPQSPICGLTNQCGYEQPYAKRPYLHKKRLGD